MKSFSKIQVIFDTDTNNELDDQHALAYLLFNGETFHLEGVTVNATYNGGDISKHFEEAERVLKLCDCYNKAPILKGANGNFSSIKKHLGDENFDGSEAVSFIIDKAKKSDANDKLVIIAVGKLTNIALAIKKNPSIKNKIRIVWLGSNYPEPGEYNLENDTTSLNYILQQDVHFEMVTVRYGKESGTGAVLVNREDVIKNLAGNGPTIINPVKGRHGGLFYNFGDYSLNLFENCEYYGDPPSRALYDMAAVAIVKNSSWARSTVIPCPILKDNKWIDQANNPRNIVLWEDFQKDKIINDLYNSLHNYVLVNEAKTN